MRKKVEKVPDPKPSILNNLSLREQVYYYLREEMNSGRLQPGSTININGIAARLGISKTPLREALIQLELEGFVEILPRRGVRVATMTLREIRNLYEITGYLEGGVIADCFDRIDSDMVAAMRALNQKMRRAINNDQFDDYYQLNLDFHGVYVDLSDNEELKRILTISKQRLYDFPRRGYIREWELGNCDEHDIFLEHVEKGEVQKAVGIMRDVHWSFKVQEKPIRTFYRKVAEQIEADLAEKSRI